eukprot:m.71291 g.71291  ORF g.71291 m.71291 type:complete len:636 (-) comp12232_c0_seq2:76-1983(-)
MPKTLVPANALNTLPDRRSARAKDEKVTEDGEDEDEPGKNVLMSTYSYPNYNRSGRKSEKFNEVDSPFGRVDSVLDGVSSSLFSQNTRGAASRPKSTVTTLVIKPKSEWMQDKMAMFCFHCHDPFTRIKRKHHCRLCGKIFCHKCSPSRQHAGWNKQVRCCLKCFEDAQKQPLFKQKRKQTSKNAEGKTVLVLDSGGGGGGESTEDNDMTRNEKDKASKEPSAVNTETSERLIRFSANSNSATSHQSTSTPTTLKESVSLRSGSNSSNNTSVGQGSRKSAIDRESYLDIQGANGDNDSEEEAEVNIVSEQTVIVGSSSKDVKRKNTDWEENIPDTPSDFMIEKKDASSESGSGDEVGYEEISEEEDDVDDIKGMRAASSPGEWAAYAESLLRKCSVSSNENDGPSSPGVTAALTQLDLDDVIQQETTTQDKEKEKESRTIQHKVTERLEDDIAANDNRKIQHKETQRIDEEVVYMSGEDLPFTSNNQSKEEQISLEGLYKTVNVEEKKAQAAQRRPQHPLPGESIAVNPRFDPKSSDADNKHESSAYASITNFQDLLERSLTVKEIGGTTEDTSYSEILGQEDDEDENVRKSQQGLYETLDDTEELPPLPTDGDKEAEKDSKSQQKGSKCCCCIQ